MDFQLFGLTPLAFYGHHLISLWFAAVLTFVLLYRRVGVFWGGVTAVLFLIGAPVVVVSQQLMARHYVTGLVFTLLAVLFYLRARGKKNIFPLAVAAFFYLAAMLNKEIFTPLPMVLFFFDKATINERLRAIAPFACMAGLYIIWRTVMLGETIGGYGNNSLFNTGNIMAAIHFLPGVFFGVKWSGFAGPMVLFFAGLLLIREPRARYPFVASIVMLLLPLLAIKITLNVTDYRFGFFPWWGICVMVSLAFAGWKNRYLWRMCCVAVFVAVVGAHTVTTANSYNDIVAAYDVQGRFLWSRGKRYGYIPSGAVAGDIPFQYGTSALNNAIRGETPVVIPFIEGASLVGVSSLIFYYDEVCCCMKNVENDTNIVSLASQTAVPGLLQGVMFDRSKDGLKWQLRVPDDTSCSFLFPRLNIAAQIPCAGQIFYNLPAWLLGEFRALAHTKKGLWATSPVLMFPEKGKSLQWIGKDSALVPGSFVTKQQEEY